MKNLTVLFIISASFLANLNAQERTNEVLPKEFIIKSQKLTSATGWEKNETTGKWIDNKNLIFDKKIDRPYTSTDNQSFKSIQFSKVKYDDSSYYIFLYEHLKGLESYNNRSLYGEGNVTSFFVMTEEQYINLKNKIESKSGENIIIQSESFGEMTDLNESFGGLYLYTEENLILKIIKAIKSPSFREQTMIVNSQISQGDEVARFLLPISTTNWRGNHNERMNIMYFEVIFSQFKSILIE